MTRPADSGALRCAQRSSSATLCPIESRNVTSGKPFNKTGLGLLPTSLLAATMYQPGAKAVWCLTRCSVPMFVMIARAQFLRSPSRALFHLRK